MFEIEKENIENYWESLKNWIKIKIYVYRYVNRYSYNLYWNKCWEF